MRVIGAAHRARCPQVSIGAPGGVGIGGATVIIRGEELGGFDTSNGRRA